MNKIIMLVAAIGLLFATVFALRGMINGMRSVQLRNHLGRVFGERREALANIAEGTHEYAKSMLTDAAITTRGLLYKIGSDANHIAVCGTTDVPIGIVNDEATAAEAEISVQLIGRGATKLMVADGVISAGALVYVGATGFVSASGTQIIGISLNATTTEGNPIEVIDVPPVSATPGVAASLYDAHTILYATTDNTPVALTVGASTIVGRKASGNIVALTGAEARLIAMSGLSSVVATPVAAAGSTVADAGQLGTTELAFITSDSAAKGVKLPTGVAGMQILVVNNSSTAAELYAASGGTVNGLSADASVVVPASKGLLCLCTAADTWVAFDLAAKATAS